MGVYGVLNETVAWTAFDTSGGKIVEVLLALIAFSTKYSFFAVTSSVGVALHVLATIWVAVTSSASFS